MHESENHDVAVVSAKGARRWQVGHPWIYRSDVTQRPTSAAGAVRVHDHRGKPIGIALWSPTSEISLRMVDRNPRVALDRPWWNARIAAALVRRHPLRAVACLETPMYDALYEWCRQPR